MHNNSVDYTRKFRRSRAVSMTTTYSDSICAVIREQFAPLRNAAKSLARLSGVSPRTAENWLQGTHAPNGESLVNLMSECREIEAEVLRLVAERRAARGER